MSFPTAQDPGTVATILARPDASKESHDSYLGREINRWHQSKEDEANRLKFVKGGATEFGALNGYNWYNAAGVVIASLSDAGVLTLGGAAIWTSANDGAGSGLDADLLDGINSTGFAQVGFLGSGDFNTYLTAGLYRFEVPTANGPGYNYSNVLIAHAPGSDTIAQLAMDYSTGSIKARGASGIGGTPAWNPWRTFWHDGNDGAGSGLDADLLDGQQGSYYAPLASPSFTGTVNLPGDSFVSSDGDYYAIRASSPTTGVIFLGDSGLRYLYFDSVNYQMPGANLVVNGGTVWHSGNDGAGSGLDADTVDGLQVATSGANIIPRTDGGGHVNLGGGYLFSAYINTSDDVSTGTMTGIMGKFGDNYHRTGTAAKVQSFLGGTTWGAKQVFQGTLENASALAAQTAGWSALEIIARADTLFSAGAATISFHRPNLYACHFGIDTDNEFKFGNWSEGAVSYRFYHAKNSPQGTYTPTGTPITNCTAVTVYTTNYFKLGGHTHVYGRVLAFPAAAGFCRFDLSLPIASNLTAGEQLAGTGQGLAGATETLGIFAEAVNDRARCDFNSVTGAAVTFSFSYSYPNL